LPHRVHQKPIALKHTRLDSRTILKRGSSNWRIATSITG
jgi:hypothetical protein